MPIRLPIGLLLRVTACGIVLFVVFYWFDAEKNTRLPPVTGSQGSQMAQELVQAVLATGGQAAKGDCVMVQRFRLTVICTVAADRSALKSQFGRRGWESVEERQQGNRFLTILRLKDQSVLLEGGSALVSHVSSSR